MCKCVNFKFLYTATLVQNVINIFSFLHLRTHCTFAHYSFAHYYATLLVSIVSPGLMVLAMLMPFR
jgi:hypothetical protein